MSTAKQADIRQRLLCRIARRYRVVSEEVAIGPVRFAFTRIADPDSVLDDVAAEADLRDRLHGGRAPGDQLHLPYWAELWDSARGMGDYLVRQARAAEPTPSTSDAASTSRGWTLDLGCGMGMAGTVAAALGARVLFADLETPALLFAQLNSLPWRRRVATRRLNWQRDRLSRQFETILGADILYERAQWPFLDAFWKNHLAVGGQILLGEPGRQTGDLFIQWAGEQGWRLEMTEIAVATRERPIRIFRLLRKS